MNRRNREIWQADFLQNASIQCLPFRFFDIDIYEAPNWLQKKQRIPKYEGDVINKWDFGENNLNLIVYQCEDSSNVGCDVTFKPKCDTVLVRSYKG